MSILCDKDNYISRMNEAFKYKKEILKYIKGNRILDFGCGSGVVTSAIKEKNPDKYVVGYDQEPKMIEIAQAYGRADSFTTTFPTERFDTIILCSVLHEVFSYENGKESVTALITKLRDENLTHGGRIIIRDGFTLSCDDENSVKFQFKDPIDGRRFYREYKKNYKWEKPNFDGTYLTGTLNVVKEFLNKYTWGWDSLPREINEKVNFFSADEYLEMAKSLNFYPEYKLILQKGYFTYLRKKVIIDGMWNTHLIVILHRV